MLRLFALDNAAFVSDDQSPYTMKTIRIIAIFLMLFNAMGAIFGGWSLIQDPTGGDLQMPISFLEHSPFNDYFIPGIILLAVNGIFCLVAMFMTIFQMKHYIWMILVQGALLTGWIIIQMIMLRYIYYLHYVLGGIGLSLICIAWILKRNQGTA